MSKLNGLIIDEKTGKIRIGIGASGFFTAVLKAEAESIDPETDVVLFIISSPAKSGGLRYTINDIDRIPDQPETCVFKAMYKVDINEDGEYECNIYLANEDTRTIPVGEYLWNAILITSPAYDEQGYPYADERSDDVIPFYTDGERPAFSVEEVGTIV